MPVPLFVSFIDRKDNPLLIRPIGECSKKNEIKYNVASNLALDYFQELIQDNKSLPPQFLLKIDEVVVYGEHLSQKGFKILIGMPQRDDSLVSPLFQQVRLFYLKSVMNPFNDDWIDQIKHKLDEMS